MYTTHTTCICMYIHFCRSEGWDVDGLVNWELGLPAQLPLHHNGPVQCPHHCWRRTNPPVPSHAPCFPHSLRIITILLIEFFSLSGGEGERARFIFSSNISSSPSSPPLGNHQTVSDLMRCVGARPILAQKHFKTTTPFIHGPFTGMVTILLEDTWVLHERTSPTAVWMDVVELYELYTTYNI